MSKSTSSAVFMLGLLLLFGFLARATRPDPADGEKASPLPQGDAVEEQQQVAAAAAEGCGDECMMRRTLEAHLDYIYTQEKKN